jgi:hypothetical protein
MADSGEPRPASAIDHEKDLEKSHPSLDESEGGMREREKKREGPRNG